MKTHRVPPGTLSGDRLLAPSAVSLRSAPSTSELEALFQEAAKGDYSTEVVKQTAVIPSRPRSTSGTTLHQRVENTARWSCIFASSQGRSQIRSSCIPYGASTKTLPAFRGYTVSGFTDWVLELHGIRSPIASLQMGSDAEARVRLLRVPVPTSTRWDLIHDGMTLADLQRRTFQISDLAIDGYPLRANPDLVFRPAQDLGCEEESRRDVVIIEVKCTDAPIPDDLWPNARCQLWAYSKIDNFASATEVYLVGEVWNSRGTERRHTRTWRRSAGVLEDECAALFQLYRSAAPRSK